jgi:hypothetical protein
MAKEITIQKKEPGRFRVLILLLRAWFGKGSIKKEENYFLIY